MASLAALYLLVKLENSDPRVGPLSMRKLIYDLHRTLLLLLMIIRWGASPALRYLLRLGPGSLSVGYRLRRLIEAMGITYNKIGQYLAMRFDILPPEICHELERLFEGVSPMSFATVRKCLEQELGGKLGEFFLFFDSKPVGSASVAQVHKAVTLDGRTVAIKVQRPRAQETFEADMRNLRRLARLADHFGLFDENSMVEVVDEIRSFTLREMDFVIEGRTADRLRHGSSSYAYTPRIYWELTTPRLLTMEYIEGVSLLAICRLAEAGDGHIIARLIPNLELDQVIDNLARACLHQLFVTGFFHGDPHPGNILIRPDGTVVFVDFGIFGELAPEEKKLFGDYIENLALGNIEESFRCYLRLVRPTPETDLHAYRRETLQILARWYEASKDPNAPMAERHTGKYQGQMVEVMRRYHVRMRPNQLLFWRVMVVLDATALRLPARFDLISTMHSFFTGRRSPIPPQLITDFSCPSRAWTMLSLGRRLPGHAAGLLNKLGRHQVGMRVRCDRSPRTRRHQGRALDWLLLSIIALPPATLAAGRMGEPGIPLTLGGAVGLLLVAVTILGRRR